MTSIYIKCLKSEIFESGAAYGEFLIDSLNPGQGITIGNHLRRILLGDLGGKAISSVRIAGIKHEFSTIPGIREDILELLLNFKGIVFQFENKNTEFGRLKVQGPAVVTADQIDLPPGLEIVNKNHYLATVVTSTVLEIEFKIDFGTGYKLVTKTLSNQETDFLDLDSVFMPVKSVNFRIENIYDVNENVSERLFLEINTDGSILPSEALKTACNESINLFTSLINNKIDTTNKISESDNKILKIEPYLEIPIEELQLSVRAYNCLKKAQINTVGDLLQYSPKKLKELKNFGKKSADEVFSTLKNKFGITFQ